MNRIKTWTYPILLGFFTALGLVPALLGDGIYDIISACLLATPLVTFLYHYLKPSRQ